MEANYNVGGMTCGGCASSVTKVSQAAAPEARVEVDLEQGVLRVEGEHDPERVRSAVEDAGFTFAAAS